MALLYSDKSLPTGKISGRYPDAGTVGALVVGGDHPGLGIVRSLGRRGIPVYVVDDQPCISSLSRYASRVIRVPDILDPAKTLEAVLEVGNRFNLRGWVLIPTRDESVAAFSRYRDQLSAFFRVTTGDWERTQWAWDKAKTYQLSERLGIPCPRTFIPRDVTGLPLLYPNLPLAIKPAIKENFFYATGAKAWRADTPSQLDELYSRAARQIPAEEILIQEIIPGNGTAQYSWCAFVQDGRPHSTLSARRMRQHPREFGRAATYVETIDAPELDEYSERIMRAINYHGLVEIEYKRDDRDGQYKLLDVNARAWGFHSLGGAAGVDFSWLLYADALGLPVDPVHAKTGVGWLRLLTDIPTAFRDIFSGHLSVSEYLRSLRATGVESVFAWTDPLPAVFDAALLPYILFKKYPTLLRRKP